MDSLFGFGTSKKNPGIGRRINWNFLGSSWPWLILWWVGGKERFIKKVGGLANLVNWEA